MTYLAFLIGDFTPVLIFLSIFANKLFTQYRNSANFVIALRQSDISIEVKTNLYADGKT